MGVTFNRPYKRDPEGKSALRKIAAMNQLLTDVQEEELKTGVLDCFGGKGVMMRPFLEKFPNLRYEIRELDPSLTEDLRRKVFSKKYQNVTVRQKDFFLDDYLEPFSAVCLDWNSFTVLHWERNRKLRETIEKVAECARNFLFINDTSVNKFHLNFRSYDCEGVSWDLEYPRVLEERVLSHLGFTVDAFVNQREVSYLRCRRSPRE